MKGFYKYNFLILIFLLILSAFNLYAKKTIVRSAAEISAAMLTSQPGDTLVMANGTWTNQKINIKGLGTSLQKIVVKAETAGKVLLVGNSTLKIGGNYLIVDGLTFQNGFSSSGDVIEFRSSDGSYANNCRLTNTSIIDYNSAIADTNKWVSIYGQYNRVDHCYLKGKTNNGTTLVVWRPTDKPDYHLIDSNYFAYRPLIKEENGGETIRVGTSDKSLSDSFTTVEYNYFEECNGETEIISSKSCGNIYRYNTFKDCQGTLTLRHGNRCTVEGNFFLCGNKTNSGGIRIIGEDHKVFNNYIENSGGDSFKSAITLMNGVPNSPLNRYFQVKKAVVVFNTVINSRETLNIGGGKDSELSLPPLDCTIANNLFYSTRSPLVTLTDNPINLTWTGNIFYGSSIGMTLPTNNYNENPLLIKSSDILYRLASNSPAINRSDINYTTNKDMDGQTRIGINDSGADEYSQDPSIIKPLTKNDVGPLWMRTTTSVTELTQIPLSFLLNQNYPNPFNPITAITYCLKENTNVSLLVFDLLGRIVSELVNKEQSAGTYNIHFDAGKLSSGVYLFKLSNGRQYQIKKGILLK